MKTPSTQHERLKRLEITLRWHGKGLEIQVLIITPLRDNLQRTTAAVSSTSLGLLAQWIPLAHWFVLRFQQVLELQHDETCAGIASMAYERPQTLASGVERPHHAVAAMAYRWHVVTRRARQSPGQRRTRGRTEEVVAADQIVVHDL